MSQKFIIYAAGHIYQLVIIAFVKLFLIASIPF